METFSTLLAFCAGNSQVTRKSPQRPITWSLAVFFDLRLNKRLSKQWRGWWFETPLRPLWRHCNSHSDVGHKLGRQCVCRCPSTFRYQAISSYRAKYSVNRAICKITPAINIYELMISWADVIAHAVGEKALRMFLKDQRLRHNKPLARLMSIYSERGWWTQPNSYKTKHYTENKFAVAAIFLRENDLHYQRTRPKTKLFINIETLH